MADPVTGETDFNNPAPTPPTSTIGPYIPDKNALPADSPFGSVFASITNAPQSILALFNAVESVIPQIAGMVSSDIGAPLQLIGKAQYALIDRLLHAIEHANLTTWDGWIKIAPTSTLYHEMLQDGMNLHPDDWDEEAKKGVDTVDRMLAFAAIMPLLGSVAALVGKIPLANRWTEAIGESLARIPEEMGLSWALGLVIDRAFEAALGESVNEAIRYEKRPTRIEWPVLRTMVRQHLFDNVEIDKHGNITGTVDQSTQTKGDHVLRHMLATSGFPDSYIDLLMGLSDQMLPVGDLQAMYLSDILTEKEVAEYIPRLGFSDKDAKRLTDLYISKANTTSASELRTTARELFRRNLISESQYRVFLDRTFFPKKEIDNDIAAINLEHEVGRTQLSQSTIRQQLLHQLIGPEAARTELLTIGTTPEAADELIKLWSQPPTRARRNLSQSRILSYLMSGVISKEQAKEKLLSLGLSTDDISLLVNHPQTHPGVTLRRRTPSLVISAYLDGALSFSELEPALVKAGVADEDMNYYLDIAKYRYSHRKHSTANEIPLTKAEILQAWKYSIWDEHTAMNGLLQLGYNIDNAQILLDIENKGPIQPAATPIFSSLTDAIMFMESLGYGIILPPDPKLLAAESVLAANGYGWTPPNPNLNRPPVTPPTPEPRP